MFIPMFSWNVFRVNLIKEGYVSYEQLHAMQKECYTMRKNDPIGRSRSKKFSIKKYFHFTQEIKVKILNYIMVITG
jgi:hypothetical protein